MVKDSDIYHVILKKSQDNLNRVKEIEENIDVKLQTQIKKVEGIERDLKENRKESENKMSTLQNQYLQILSLFVAIIGILFAFIQFAKEFEFIQAATLLIILASILFSLV